MDFVIFGTVLNIIWYVFTIIFMLYKFTSFFTWVYNSLKFLSKAKDGIFWIKDKILGLKKNYLNLSENDLESAQPINFKYGNDFAPSLSGKTGHIKNVTHFVSPESHLTQAQWNKMIDSMVSIPASEYNEFKNFINNKNKKLKNQKEDVESNLLMEQIHNKMQKAQSSFHPLSKASTPPFRRS
jgi:hypothetical protein